MGRIYLPEFPKGNRKLGPAPRPEEEKYTLNSQKGIESYGLAHTGSNRTWLVNSQKGIESYKQIGIATPSTPNSEFPKGNRKNMLNAFG